MDSVKYLTLQLNNDLREKIFYSNHSIPFSTCIDRFDDYLGQEWSSHWHDEYEFGLVLNGKVEFTIYSGNKIADTVELAEGDGIFISSGFLHSAKAKEENTVMAGVVFSNVFFNIKPFESIMNELIKPLTNPKISHIYFNKEDDACEDIRSTLDTICHIPKSEQRYELHCIELVFKLWRHTLDMATGIQSKISDNSEDTLRQQRLKLMVSFIHSNYSESITVDDIAKHALISRTECFRCFKDILKKSPTQYVTEYRLSMAGSLLATTNRELSDIIFSCGFHSMSYFGKCFKEHYGISPKKYRERMNKKQK